MKFVKLRLLRGLIRNRKLMKFGTAEVFEILGAGLDFCFVVATTFWW